MPQSIKKYKVFLAVTAVMLITLITSSLIAYAADPVNLFCADKNTDETVTVTYDIHITWDAEIPEVFLHSPSGIIYDVFAAEDETVLLVYDGYAVYKLGEAEEGQWSVSCDKKTNENVNISMSTLTMSSDFSDTENVQSDTDTPAETPIQSNDNGESEEETQSETSQVVPIICLIITVAGASALNIFQKREVPTEEPSEDTIQ